jgi:hypothetical protein
MRAQERCRCCQTARTCALHAAVNDLAERRDWQLVQAIMCLLHTLTRVRAFSGRSCGPACARVALCNVFGAACHGSPMMGLASDVIVNLNQRQLRTGPYTLAAGFGSVDTHSTVGVIACVCRLLFRAMIWKCLTYLTEVRGFAR